MKRPAAADFVYHHLVVQWQKRPGITWSAAQKLRRARLAEAHRSTCVIVGNGPSLAKTPLETLHDVTVFGLNNCFSWLGRLPDPPAGVFVQDPLAIRRFERQLAGLPPGVLRIMPERARKYYGTHRTHAYFSFRPRGLMEVASPVVPSVASLLALGLQSSFTVTSSAIQLAVLAGFRRIFLVGCDNTYALPENAVLLGHEPYGILRLKVGGADENHYDSSYYDGGEEIFFAPRELHEQSYAWCARLAGREGVVLRNASLAGEIGAIEPAPFAAIRSPTSDGAPPPR